MVAFTKTLAREVSHKGITVNAVAPGFIETDMTAAIPEKARELVLEMIPLGRMGTCKEVALAVILLANPGASYITGQVLSVNSGLYM